MNMKSAKFWMQQLFLFALILGWRPCARAECATETVDGVDWTYYTVYDSEAWVGGGPWIPAVPKDTIGSIVIPSTLGGYPVTGIAPFAFRECSGLTNVTIPSRVRSIGEQAFHGCSGLTSVTIPDSVRSIGERAFGGCSGLTSVTIPGSVTNIERYLFAGCSGLTNLVISDGVTSIGQQAFDECSGLTSVTIPDSVTNIGYCAFAYCDGLKTLFAPASWESKYIEERFWRDYAGVLSGCKVLYSPLEVAESERIFSATAETNQQLEVTANVPWRAESSSSWLTVKTENGNGSGMVVYELAENTGMDARMATITIAGGGVVYTFTVTQHSAHEPIEWHYTVSNGQASLGSGHLENTAIPSWTLGPIVIPSTLGGYPVTIIGDSAFYGCSGLTSVTIPNSVTRIERFAFKDCSGLRNITIPSSVTSIGIYSFQHCTGLTSVVLPDGVTNIMRAAFIGCSELTSVTIPDSVTNIQRYVFMGCSSLKTMHVPEWWSAKYVEGIFWREYTCVPEECNVVYGAPPSQLVLGASERSISAAAMERQMLAVTANVAWTAESLASWLTVATSNGSGNGSIEYAVAANTGAGSRSGAIIVSGGGLTRTFTVTQSGVAASLELEADSKTFSPDAASGMKLSVTANVSWTAASSVSWLTVATTSGSGNGSIEYAVAANPKSSSRTGTITVSGGGLTRTFTVTQGGVTATLELGANSRTFASDAANGMELPVTANVSWTAVSSASWLAVKTPNGTGNGVVAYDVTANPETAERMAAITVTGGGLTRIFLATQSGQTETQGTPVGVPCQWLAENAAGILAAHGGNYETAALALATNGLPVWQCYVAGLSTTDKEAKFKVKSIAFKNGEPVVEWVPDMNEERAYKLLGKRTLADETWDEVPDGTDVETEGWRFFRVQVELPRE
jgi:hypothetical protein